MKPTIEDITGFLGVGTLDILGIFFILDGSSGFLSFIEIYSKTSAWAILVTIPLLVVAYIFGLLTSLGTEMILNRVFSKKLPPELFGIIVSIDNDLLNTKFVEIERQSRLLNGCAFAFLLLAIGSWVEVPMMGRFGFVGYIGLFGGLMVSIMCPIMARQLQDQFFQRISTVGNEQPNQANSADAKSRAAD